MRNCRVRHFQWFVDLFFTCLTVQCQENCFNYPTNLLNLRLFPWNYLQSFGSNITETTRKPFFMKKSAKGCHLRKLDDGGRQKVFGTSNFQVETLSWPLLVLLDLDSSKCTEQTLVYSRHRSHELVFSYRIESNVNISNHGMMWTCDSYAEYLNLFVATLQLSWFNTIGNEAWVKFTGECKYYRGLWPGHSDQHDVVKLV